MANLTGKISSRGSMKGTLKGLEKIQGYSAYQVAVINGFEGSEEEWLASLVGPQGEKGEPGKVIFEELTEEEKEMLKGNDGESGKDGVSCTHKWEGTRLTVTSASGTSSADLKGEPGEDGYTPRKGVDYYDGEPGKDGSDGKDGVSCTHSWNGTVLTVTSASGTSSADLKGETGAGFKVLDYYASLAALQAAVPAPNVGDAYGIGTGEPYDIYIYGATSGWRNNGPLQGAEGKPGKDGSDGKDGENGSDGADGFSPTVAITPINGGNRVSITDASGTKAFDVMNGSDGSDGQDGSSGSDGEDGVSPTITVSSITGGNRLTIKDASGTKTVDIMNGSDGKDGSNGSDGKTPVKGTDYFTAADKQEIAEQAAALVEIPEGFSGDYNDLKNKPTIPTQLSQLSGDTTHRVVTDAQITAWNGKSNFSGSYNDLTNVPSSFTPAAHNQAASTVTAGTFAGQVAANSSGETHSNYLLRNTRLASADTNPTVNGEICWTYK